MKKFTLLVGKNLANSLHKIQRRVGNINKNPESCSKLNENKLVLYS